MAIALSTHHLSCLISALEGLEAHVAVLALHPLGKIYQHWQDWDIIWSSESKDFKLGGHSGGEKKKSYLASVTVFKVRLCKALVD